MLMVLERDLEEQMKAQREASGADRFDEVWEGVYMMAPLADDEHQDFQILLGVVFVEVIQRHGLGVARAGVNVSDREEGWARNYRIPDVAVFLNGGTARNCGTHWVGGPDFAVEIVSPDDRSRDKLQFYADVKTRELMVLDRDPWALELYRLDGGRLRLVGTSNTDKSETLVGEVLPLSFRLVGGVTRPRIEITRHDGTQRWTI